MKLRKLLESCHLCPRKCGVNRINGQTGACNETLSISAARAALHMWEEPCISGENGSGAVFFSGCSLGCAYCQNHDISGGLNGKEITIKRLSEIFFELKEQGANNINLVTPDHFIPQIIEAIDMAKEQGFNLPFVYNCSGYEEIDALKLLDTLTFTCPILNICRQNWRRDTVTHRIIRRWRKRHWRRWYGRLEEIRRHLTRMAS